MDFVLNLLTLIDCVLRIVKQEAFYEIRTMLETSVAEALSHTLVQAEGLLNQASFGEFYANYFIFG